ncbi:hypothetical protein IW150_002555 [Coemansia sp. RSA 2607]|nr:hypothetical protein IW150_002555 [Coemansia sp. RSA 2607]
MPSYLHKPIGSSFADPQAQNSHTGNIQHRVGSRKRVADSMNCPAGGASVNHNAYPLDTATQMPMPEPVAVPDSYFNSTSNIGREVRQEDLHEPDPLLAATMRDLYEDMAPTNAVRSWNREYIDRAYPHNHGQRVDNTRSQNSQPRYNQTQPTQMQPALIQPEQDLISYDLPEYSQVSHSKADDNHTDRSRLGIARSPSTSGESNYSPSVFEQEHYPAQTQPMHHQDDQDYFDARHFEQSGSSANAYEHISGLQYRAPSVHSISGYGMYGEGVPVGPSAAESLGRQAQTVECPWCHARVTTRIKRRIGFKAGGAAVLVAAIAWPLFWVPLVVPGLHRKTHFCPQCRRKIGRGRRYVQ